MQGSTDDARRACGSDPRPGGELTPGSLAISEPPVAQRQQQADPRSQPPPWEEAIRTLPDVHQLRRALSCNPLSGRATTTVPACPLRNADPVGQRSEHVSRPRRSPTRKAARRRPRRTVSALRTRSGRAERMLPSREPCTLPLCKSREPPPDEREIPAHVDARARTVNVWGSVLRIRGRPAAAHCRAGSVDRQAADPGTERGAPLRCSERRVPGSCPGRAVAQAHE